MRLLPCGDSAILVELADGDERRRFDLALQLAALPEVTEQVPAARTVLVRATRPEQVPRLAEALRRIDSRDVERPAGAAADILVIETAYDGEDLAEVAAHLGIEPDEVVARHTGQVWTVEFAGFIAGFGYLVGDAGGLDVPRRATPRTRVPAGAVGLAGPYTGVYPRASPGGWQLIGTTRLAIWDEHRDPPALLTPGTRVRFAGVAP